MVPFEDNVERLSSGCIDYSKVKKYKRIYLRNEK